jgi:DNA-damage-inducible protein J
MAAKHLVQAWIDDTINEEAAAVLATMGLTVSDAVRLLLTKVAHDGVLPFDPLVPNAVTNAAMMAARADDTVTVRSLTDLMADLHADENPDPQVPCPSDDPNAAQQMALARQIMDDDSDVLRALAKT